MLVECRAPSPLSPSISCNDPVELYKTLGMISLNYALRQEEVEQHGRKDLIRKGPMMVRRKFFDGDRQQFHDKASEVG